MTLPAKQRDPACCRPHASPEAASLLGLTIRKPCASPPPATKLVTCGERPGHASGRKRRDRTCRRREASTFTRIGELVMLRRFRNSASRYASRPDSTASLIACHPYGIPACAIAVFISKTGTTRGHGDRRIEAVTTPASTSPAPSLARGRRRFPDSRCPCRPDQRRRTAWATNPIPELTSETGVEVSPSRRSPPRSVSAALSFAARRDRRVRIAEHFEIHQTGPSSSSRRAKRADASSAV